MCVDSRDSRAETRVFQVFGGRTNSAGPNWDGETPALLWFESLRLNRHNALKPLIYAHRLPASKGMLPVLHSHWFASFADRNRAFSCGRNFGGPPNSLRRATRGRDARATTKFTGSLREEFRRVAEMCRRVACAT